MALVHTVITVTYRYKLIPVCSNNSTKYQYDAEVSTGICSFIYQ